MAGLADLFEFFLCKKFDPLGHFAPKIKKKLRVNGQNSSNFQNSDSSWVRRLAAPALCNGSPKKELKNKNLKKDLFY